MSIDNLVLAITTDVASAIKNVVYLPAIPVVESDFGKQW